MKSPTLANLTIIPMKKMTKKFNRNRKNALRVSSIDLFSYFRYQFSSMGKALSKTAVRVTELADYYSILDTQVRDNSRVLDENLWKFQQVFDLFKQRTATIIISLLCISIAQAAMLFILLFV